MDSSSAASPKAGRKTTNRLRAIETHGAAGSSGAVNSRKTTNRLRAIETRPPPRGTDTPFASRKTTNRLRAIETRHLHG